MIKSSWVVEADGDENIPGSTQPSLGQNESTMERHVTTPFTQPSKQTSGRGTPQTNSPSNVHSPTVNSQQPANMENPAMQAMAPEGNGNIIMQGSNWKSTDYLESIKTASDSEIYYQGFHDGRSGKEMDKSLSNLSDDYFNGWQDGQIYVHDPVSENVSNQPQKRSLGLIDMKPGSNSLPNLSQENFSLHNASVDTECNECGSIRIAHCGTCDGSSEDLKETTENVEGPAADAKNTQNMQVAGSVSCKNCSGSGIVCIDCGCAR